MVNFKLTVVTIFLTSFIVTNGSSIKAIENTKIEYCDMCKKLFSYIYKSIDEEKTIDSIEDALNSVCETLFYGPRAVKCDDYVSRYTRLIVDTVHKASNPEEACTMTRLCPDSVASHVQFMSNSDSCNECIVDIGALKTYFTATRAELTPKLEKCCGQYPTPDGQCELYMASVDSIFDDLESKLMPRELCRTFKVCPATQAAGAMTSKQGTVDKIKPDCILCKQVMKLVYQVVRKKTKADIEEALDKVCDNLLPESSIESCHEFVATYTDVLIDFIHKHEDPAAACILIGLCEPINIRTYLSVPPSRVNLISTPKVSSSIQCDQCNRTVQWAVINVSTFNEGLTRMWENACLYYTKNNEFCGKYMADVVRPISNQLADKTSDRYFCYDTFGLCP